MLERFFVQPAVLTRLQHGVGSKNPNASPPESL
jgi:hypothetical protein